MGLEVRRFADARRRGAAMQEEYSHRFITSRRGERRSTATVSCDQVSLMDGIGMEPPRAPWNDFVHFIGCFWKNSHIRSLAEMSLVDFPMNRTGGSCPGHV
jgi:hypothetical protein